MNTTYAKCDKDTAVQYNGKTLRLTQQPFLDVDFNLTPQKNVYEAIALDEDDEEYRVTWQIIDHECEDESDACDWDSYTVREL